MFFFEEKIYLQPSWCCRPYFGLWWIRIKKSSQHTPSTLLAPLSWLLSILPSPTHSWQLKWIQRHNKPTAGCHRRKYSLQVQVWMHVWVTEVMCRIFFFITSEEIWSHDLFYIINLRKDFKLFSNYGLFSFWKYLARSNNYFNDLKSCLNLKHFTNIPVRQNWLKKKKSISLVACVTIDKNRSKITSSVFPPRSFILHPLHHIYKSGTEVSPCQGSQRITAHFKQVKIFSSPLKESKANVPLF
jgi:hypothetical protein